MKVAWHKVLDGDAAQVAWRLYEGAFRPLDELAVQRHLMYRSEFDEVMADDRVRKYTAHTDAGELAGLSTFTNRLESMPLISPAYFARRWPTQYAQGRVWYCGFVAVEPPHSGAFGDLVEAMWVDGTADRGLIALDFCEYNDVTRRMGRVIGLMLHRLAGQAGDELVAVRLDQQKFWGYQAVPR